MTEEIKMQWEKIKRQHVMAIVVLRFVYIKTKHGNPPELSDFSDIEDFFESLIMLVEAKMVKDNDGLYVITELGKEIVKYQETIGGRN